MQTMQNKLWENYWKERGKATHMVYAYRFLDDDKPVEGHSDDGETGASKILMETLKSAKASSLLVIFRKYGGLNLGQRRFEIYQTLAKNLVQKIEPDAKEIDMAQNDTATGGPP